MLPAMLPALLQVLQDALGLWESVPLQLITSLVLLLLAVILYQALLPGQGRLLQRREKAILDVVTREVE